ncbi:uncharacterized protein LOC132751223 [Ruditapes philippinarum]|uniref:uncharacterized protein LOC132751223 n=1 Tax=Ruditapes philippinarum TaxID=129788 RepID=UPI00295BBCAA|nr:uncharacterized protein LOC132751223 [Ruditapes philippinarum]
MAEIKFTKSTEEVSLINADDQPIETTTGLNVFTTCLFIVGVIAGSGFLTLPKAIDDSGWIGFVLILFCCFVSAYTGDILGKCWIMVVNRHPEFDKAKLRYPYPTIGQEAFGKWGRFVVSFSINFTQFGGTVVYILLAAENIVTLLPSDTKITCCYIALIVGAAMTPFTWLGTPKDFWGIAAAATLATSIASVILFAAVLYNGREVDISEVTHTKVDVITFFTAYGTICFAFNGHPAFPTFQSDMANPRKFGRALILGYLIVLFMYLPSSAAGYAVYGSQVQPNVLNTIPKGVTSTLVSLLMTAHLLFGIIIVINPVSQELEHFINIPEHFTWKRVLARTITMASALFVVASVPHFSSILSLVGGSTISILAFICPCLFYLKLCRGDKDREPVHIPLHTKVLLYEIIFTGFVAGIAATYSAITDLAVNKFTVPCYVDPSRACSQQAAG